MVTTEELYNRLHSTGSIKELDHLITDCQCEYDYDKRTIKKRIEDLPHFVAMKKEL